MKKTLAKTMEALEKVP